MAPTLTETDVCVDRPGGSQPLDRHARSYADACAVQLSADEKLRAAQMLDELAHQARTPLAVISEYASLWREGLLGPTNEEQKSAARLIEDRVWDLSRWLDDLVESVSLLLGTTHVNRGTIAPSKLMQHLLPKAVRKAELLGLRFEYHAGDELPDVYCDSTLCARLLANVIGMGLEGAVEASRVELTTSTSRRREYVQWELTCRQNGHRPAPLQKLFQTSPVLACRNVLSSLSSVLLRLNLGTFSVFEDSEGRTHFRIRLPASNPTAIVSAYLRQHRPDSSSGRAVTALAIRVEQGDIENRGRGYEPILRCCASSDDVIIPVSTNCFVVLLRDDVRSPNGLLERMAEATRGDTSFVVHASCIGRCCCSCDQNRFREQVVEYIVAHSASVSSE